MLIFCQLVISDRKYFFLHEIKKVKMIPTFIFFRIRNNRFYPIGMEFICHVSKQASRLSGETSTAYFVKANVRLKT